MYQAFYAHVGRVYIWLSVRRGIDLLISKAINVCCLTEHNKTYSYLVTSILAFTCTLSCLGRDKWPPFPRQHFQMHCFNNDIWISVKISLKIFPRSIFNSIPTLIQIMAWRPSGTRHYLNQWWLDYGRLYPSLGSNVLIHRGRWRTYASVDRNTVGW